QRLDVTGAAEQFREAVRIDPDFALAHYRLSRVAEWLGDEDEVLHAADRSLALIDKLPLSYRDIVKASALYFQGTHTVAIPLLEIVLAREPENKEALYVLSEIYVHSARDSDLSRVTSLLEQILKLDPDFHLAYHHLAFAYIFQGEIGKANALLDRWEAEEPEVVREARSWIAALEGRHDEALRLLEGLAAPYVAVFRVRNAMLMSRWDLAREFVSLDQSEGYFRTQLLRLQGVLHVYQGHFDQAVAAYREAGTAMGSRRDEGLVGGSAASALQSLSELLVLKGNREAAQAEAERALAIQPESPRCLYFAGVFALRNGNFPAAGRYLEKVKQLMSVVRSTSAHLYRDSLEAEIALMQGRPHEAKLLFEKVVGSRKFLLDQATTFTSAGAAVRDGLARTYLALGEKEKAAEALEALLASGWERADQPELYVRAMYRLGMLRLDAGDTVGGSEFLRKFLDHWGEADWNLLEVTEAKARLAALGGVEAAGVQ
ncbi:MAG: tetratricopeptide repeat protein, partial [Acidobacteriota bacterium]